MFIQGIYATTYHHVFQKERNLAATKSFSNMRKITTKNFSQQVSLPFIQMEVVPRDSKV